MTILRKKWIHKHKFEDRGRIETDEGTIVLKHCVKCDKNRAFLYAPGRKRPLKIEYHWALQQLTKGVQSEG